MLFSTTHQRESAVGLPLSPPTWTSLPPLSPFHSWFYFLNWLSAALKQNIPVSICPTGAGVHAQSLRCVQLFVAPGPGLSGSSDHGVAQARILEWVAIPSSRGSSQPRDRTWVSCIGRRVLYNWATREAWCWCKIIQNLECSGKSGGDSVLIPRN